MGIRSKINHIITAVPMKSYNTTFPHMLVLDPEYSHPRIHRVRARARSFARLTSELLEQDNGAAGFAERATFFALTLAVVVPLIVSLSSLA